MPELAHRHSATDTDRTHPAAPDAAPGKQTQVGDPAGVAAATPSAVSRVRAYVGERVRDRGKFEYRVDGGTFVVTVVPEGSTVPVGRVITPDGPYATAWIALARILFTKPPPARLVPVATEAAPAVGEAERPTGTALDANLAAAQDLAAATTVPHSYDATVAGDVHDWSRRVALVAGDTAKLKTLVCSEFTSLSLAKAGVDLNRRYRDPASGLAVAWWDRTYNRLQFVDLYMVTVNQGDAAAAILAAQHDRPDPIGPGSDRAKLLKSNETEPFLYVESIAGALAPRDGDSFGAGATAQSLGGEAIAAADRRPGDLQQRFDTTRGKTDGRGHSSQVWKVRGAGVAYLGAPGSPVLVPAVKQPIEPGWYVVDGVYWELGPDTDPAMVASLRVEYVQLIEANRSTTDATGLGAMKAADQAYDPTAASSAVTSTGRLPTSKWTGWQPSTPELAGVVEPQGVRRLGS